MQENVGLTNLFQFSEWVNKLILLGQRSRQAFKRLLTKAFHNDSYRNLADFEKEKALTCWNT